MSDFNVIYQDADMTILERRIPLEDSVDEHRTIILKTTKMEFYLEFSFGKLTNTYEKIRSSIDQQ